MTTTTATYQTGQEDTRSESKSFPCKLMQILDDDGYPDIIQWLPHGRGFIISDRSRFAEEVLPKYFPKKSKFSSFNRKLNRWKFVKQMQGRKKASYFHPLFIRGNRAGCMQMCPEPQTPGSEIPTDTPVGIQSPNMAGSFLPTDNGSIQSASSSVLSPPRFAERRSQINIGSPFPLLDANVASVPQQQRFQVRRRFTDSHEEDSQFSSYMNMSFQQILALQQSLERELMVTAIEMHDLRTENLNRRTLSGRKSPPAQANRKQERRPSMGARAA